jgi:predicted enzyme related to lactoylglutathione lyase
MGNPFVHAELNSTDPATAKSFYGQLCDWQLEDMQMPEMTYTVVKVGENGHGIGGGIMKQMMPGAPSMWVPYIGVSDLKTATAKAKSLGADIMVENQEVPNMGWLSIFKDPTGAITGLWQAKM